MHRGRGLDLQRREASALFVIEQVRDLARGTRLRRHPARVVCPRRLPRGERSRPGTFTSGPTKPGGSRPRSDRSAAPTKSSPNRSANPFILLALAEGVRV
ncbi:hypothetical protein [Methanoculleus sp.]|uniref:hypothetical protein n=1 Tax=Methanoculleus sp. TaxID=90427 RepID=UPI0026265450|nr:hypothetical protein [Methanoculleus sp.]MDD2255385.1 hypothetical protein [Methanoculleus sp.]MDD2787916.1 hypothetical protein [Methanoculleus sp.]MDD4472254.1 hypothetical protein [Methanoculleus sp.]HOD86396.1 hypothetical protein [Methanoculleus sp.]HOI59324.1 hypothetical protein [Methanoculleus sp.]